LGKKERPSNLDQREAILRYLATRPHAADTLEGVVSWWLPLQRHKDTHEEIAKVLEELAAEGHLVKKKLPNNQVIYTCATAKKN
jgi:hypothetical protein